MTKNFTKCKTRFAPSPTGNLHVGGVRTAIFNWLWAKHMGGEFLIRIEDTDRARSSLEFEKDIIEGLGWLGMQADQTIIRQSNRQEIYQKYIDQLIADNLAYKCFCTKDRIEKLKETQQKNKQKPKYDGACRNLTATEIATHAGEEFVLRFKNPIEGNVQFDDLVRGTISVANSELDDLIIQRSDASPTYNFCVVVDDYEMQISHIIRGEDHINNTPRQINLYNALKFPLPEFAHLSMIHGENGKKLSKRDGAMSVNEYQKNGVLSAALINYLSRLGFSHGDQEIFTPEELTQVFNLNSITKSCAIFDSKKLNWTNQQHINKLDKKALYKEIEPILLQTLPQQNLPIWLADIAKAYQENCGNIQQLAQQVAQFVTDINPEEKLKTKWLTGDSASILKTIINNLTAIDNWQAENINQCLKDTSAELEVGFAKIGKPLRVALIGLENSPSIGDLLALLPQNWAIERLNKAVS